MSSSGSKVSFVLTFQLSSPNPTHEMMESVGLVVDEIVITRDSALLYTYLHLQRKVREQEIEACITTLASTHGMKGSNLFGYETITSSMPSASELIEDHPGFQILVQHEMNRNENFHRWTADGFSGVNCGYTLLKSRLMAKRAMQTSSGAAASSENTASAAEEEIFSDNEERIPATGEQPRRERSKRRRSISPMTSFRSDPVDRVRNTDLFNFMRTAYEDSQKAYEDRARRGDDVSYLREKAVILKYEQDRAKEKMNELAAALESQNSKLQNQQVKIAGMLKMLYAVEGSVMD